MSTAPALPPLDENAVATADADRARREAFLRKALAEGRGSPSRLRLIKNELNEIAQGKPGDGPPR